MLTSVHNICWRFLFREIGAWSTKDKTATLENYISDFIGMAWIRSGNIDTYLSILRWGKIFLKTEKKMLLDF